MDATLEQAESPLRRAARGAVVWALALSSMIATPVLAAQTDISDSPITSTNAAQVKPNIMLLMDTSASMGFAYMPDEAGDLLGPGPNVSLFPAKIGFKSSQCNVVYYDRKHTYEPPKHPDGSHFATPSFYAALYDGFDSGSATIDLSGQFRAFQTGLLRNSGREDTPHPADYYYYTPSTSAPAIYSAPVCQDDDAGGTTPASDGVGTWNYVTVGAGTGVSPHVDERDNFAIWYSYYRTRILLIKTAASLAFTPLTDSFRVGFITVSPKDNGNPLTFNRDPSAPINPAKYLPINDFTTTQRGLWFDKLFSQKPGGTSPTREGLARVGRMYANQHDGINTGMTDDPVQFSCQQNFTIMTTDGYWNTGDESTSAGGYLGGPVDISGKTLVGQRDGNLDAFSTNNPSPPPAQDVNVTPRPIWDGTFDAIRTIRDRVVHYEYQPCGTFFTKTTSQVFKRTTQQRKLVTQTQKLTVQYLQSTTQMKQQTAQTLKQTTTTQIATYQQLKATHQNLANLTQSQRTTHQTTATTRQHVYTTEQILYSTFQRLRGTQQYVSVRTRTAKYVYTPRRSTSQPLLSTYQPRQTTTQEYSQTKQHRISQYTNYYNTTVVKKSTDQSQELKTHTEKSTVQNKQSTLQHQQSTVQMRKTTSQVSQTTTQNNQYTSQRTRQTERIYRSTYQDRACVGETCDGVQPGTCVEGGGVTCSPQNSGPTLVDTCTDAVASNTNNWVRVDCDRQYSAVTGVSSCTDTPAGSGNGHTRIICDTVNTGPTPVATCSPQGANGSNDFIATTCATPTTTGPTYVPNCSDAAPVFGNNYVRTTCFPVNTGPTGVPTGTCVAQTPDMGNNYLTIDCTPNNTSAVPVPSCTESGPDNTNGYTTTSCYDAITTDVAVPSCSTSGATGLNQYTATTCTQPTTGPTTVDPATCPANIPADSGNSYVATTCQKYDVYSPSGTCAVDPPSLGNGWITTTCPHALNGPTAVDPADCTGGPATGMNLWTATTCDTVPGGPYPTYTTTACSDFYQPVSHTQYTCGTTYVHNDEPWPTCPNQAPGMGNGGETITCHDILGSEVPLPPGTCTYVPPNSGNVYVENGCYTHYYPNVPVQTCNSSPADVGNSYVATTCNPNNVLNTPVAACGSYPPASSGNDWVTTTCVVDTHTNEAVDSCLADYGRADNNWTTTTCPPETLVSGPDYGPSCAQVAASSGNGHQRTDCVQESSTVGVAQGTCVHEDPSIDNGWWTTNCDVAVVAFAPAMSCTPEPPGPGNDYTEVFCADNNHENVPYSSCTPDSKRPDNGYTQTTCPTPIETGPTPTPTACIAIPAVPLYNYISTSCPPDNVTGPTGVPSCSDVLAANGPQYTATVCGTVDHVNEGVPAGTCVDAAANGGNDYTSTSCFNFVANSVPIPNTCSAQTNGPDPRSPGDPSRLTGDVGVTCIPAVNTGPAGAPACVDQPIALPGDYITVVCSRHDVAAAPSGNCVPEAAGPGNQYTETQCPILVTPAGGPEGADTCNAATGDGMNGWTTTVCTPNNTGPTAVAGCTPQTRGPGNGWKEITCLPNNTTNVAVPSCSPSGPTSGNSYVTTTCATNPPVPTWVMDDGSCHAEAAGSGNGYVETQCMTAILYDGGTDTCSAESPNIGNDYKSTTCPAAVTTGPIPFFPCNTAPASSGNDWTSTTCTPQPTQVSMVTSCDPSAPNSGNSYTTTTCVELTGADGGMQEFATTTSSTERYNISGGTQSSPTQYPDGPPSVVGPTSVSICYPPHSAPPLPSPNDAHPTTLSPLDAIQYPSCITSGYPCTVDANVNDPHSVNSLADVAQYYYITDLRTSATDSRGPALTDDNVFAVGSGLEDDRVRWQHMTTFAVALGVSGELTYQSNYKTALTGDFADIRCRPPHDQTTCKSWPLWPDPTPGYYTSNGQPGGPFDDNKYSNPRSIDDFWHAAVNGRGTYFSAADPATVVAGLAGALAGIEAQLGSSSGAATSNLEPVTGDNYAYLGNYTTSVWSGDVQAHLVDVNTGVVQTNVVWAAKPLLDTVTGANCDNRNIYLFRKGATNNLTDFSLDTYSCDLSGNPTGAARTGLNSTEQDFFGNPSVLALSQSTTGYSPTQITAAAGANMVNFLRGQRGLENFVADDDTKLYRQRDGVLGDVVDASPVYVRAPFASYADTAYQTFKAANATRKPMLYVAANDGMLHAFFAGTSDPSDHDGGKEAWAMIPSAMLPKLFHLADANYRNIHQFFVDGTPSVSDIYDGTNWKTMLVGGYNKGGRGFYAVDVTNPTAPKGLWEFNWSDTCYDPGDSTTAGSDCHLGLSFGKPLITKLQDGRWVVIVSSGYNNVNASAKPGDGVGYLYVLNAATGQIISKIATTAGTATTPSGLAPINNLVENADQDNTTVRVYGTDTLGNVWRFQVNDATPAAFLVATVKDPSDVPQPITTRPEITTVGGKPMLFVASGKLLGATDLADLQQQSIYGFIDPVTPAPLGRLRDLLAPLALNQVGTGPTAYRTVQCTGTTAQCGSTTGWLVDLPVNTGERVNVEMKLRSYSLIVGSNVPQISACQAGGSSWLNYFDYKSGLAVVGSSNLSVSESITNSLIVGLTVIKVADGTLKAIVTTSNAGILTKTPATHAQPLNAKRISWREVVAQ